MFYFAVHEFEWAGAAAAATPWTGWSAFAALGLTVAGMVTEGAGVYLIIDGIYRTQSGHGLFPQVLPFLEVYNTLGREVDELLNG